MVAKMLAEAQSQQGFTWVEALLAIALVAILATIGVTQFSKVSIDTRNAVTKENLSLLRNAIQKQLGVMKMRCQAPGRVIAPYPSLQDLQANDITAGGSGCTAADVPEPRERVFVEGGLPENPWSASDCANQAQVFAGVLSPGAVLQPKMHCGWIYDPATGQIRANSKLNSGDRDGVFENQY
ncbi:MAG: type II secretion system protein [Oligoflexia bacterium]